MRIIDLTLPIDGNMPGVRIQTAKTIAENGWNATTLEFYSHCGTHMDAPVHFVPGGRTIEEQDLQTVVGPARVVNLAPAEPRQLVTVSDVRERIGEPAAGSRLLIRTDWHLKYGSAEYRDQLPRISIELAQYLVERKVALVGVEPPSVADVNAMQELTDVHQCLFRGGVTIVEGLANLNQIRQETVELIALPLKIVGGDGTPVRAIALERD